jgi:hypothetical protein
MTTRPEDFWDLDLRIEPARERPGPLGLTATTWTTRPACSAPPDCQSTSCTCPAYDAPAVAR